MKALRKTQAAAGLELVEIPLPVVSSPQETLIRVTATGICGSDLHVDDWTPSYSFITASLPVTIGHEFVGVADSGPLAGRRVVVRPSVTCSTCAACRAGNYDACERRFAKEKVGAEARAKLQVIAKNAPGTCAYDFFIFFTSTGTHSLPDSKVAGQA